MRWNRWPARSLDWSSTWPAGVTARKPTNCANGSNGCHPWWSSTDGWTSRTWHSFYEGLPLVLVEALASGCRLVATALPGVDRELAPRMGGLLTVVPLPRLRGADEPLEQDLPAFTASLAGAIRQSLEKTRKDGPVITSTLRTFTWRAVFGRVERVWIDLIG